ncbi:hypothetical protein QE450_004323 [Paenibacillus sp. SORGH_AS306]|uniref:hypothetical protein n=1 Tax=unclassified Paenibacillus TaxID=185978 RepID=UPI00277F2DCF|nr:MULTISPECIES: hypothetical protein [unclassified Paenibacillus]MDQ1236825.1 hypothetical protein [Paenibacillus sp. SORGH_AS_0306]MDR6109186.1 hypothetical protein [Paenibacillus sp. SORGH_AS_0338]
MVKPNLFCKVFIDTEIHQDELLHLINSEISGEVNKLEITNSTLIIEIRKNVEFDSVRSENLSDGFLFYKYYLEIEPFSEVVERDYIKAVADLLKKLWESNIGTVAACDFEDLLPRNSR